MWPYNLLVVQFKSPPFTPSKQLLMLYCQPSWRNIAIKPQALQLSLKSWYHTVMQIFVITSRQVAQWHHGWKWRDEYSAGARGIISQTICELMTKLLWRYEHSYFDCKDSIRSQFYTRQLAAGMYRIVICSDDHSLRKCNPYFRKIWNISSWPICEMGRSPCALIYWFSSYLDQQVSMMDGVN